MRTWTLTEAREDFERGLLKEARIVPIEDGEWAVQLTSKIKKDGTGWLAHSMRNKLGEQRRMKSPNAAVEAISSIGFEINSLKVE